MAKGAIRQLYKEAASNPRVGVAQLFGFEEKRSKKAEESSHSLYPNQRLSFSACVRRGSGLTHLKVQDLSDDTNKIDSIAINEVQLILAEKRTSLAVMRTGIAVLALPLSVMSVLIATSKYYDVLHVLHLLVPLGGLNIILVLFGAYLIIRSIIRMRRYDRLIHDIKLKHSIIGEFIE